MTEGVRAELGLAGLGTMGANLALNLDDHGVRTAVFDVDPERARAFTAGQPGRAFLPVHSIAELAGALERPRRILLSIPAGRPVDDALANLLPHLDTGDIVLDGGNSLYADTQRRGEILAEHGIDFLGLGISGGAEGARHGPSLMPGGPRAAYDAVAPVLERIAARSDRGPCVAWLGPGGAGHFVKMVHNGIEYADMQAIAEAYDLLRRGAGLDAEELAGIFAAWNDGPLESFLVEITAAIFTVEDPIAGGPLVERIVDEAEQKGTGRWTSMTALELGTAATAIAAAVDARVLSSRREERRRAAGVLPGPRPEGSAGDREALVADAHDALLATRLCALAQGMELLAAASAEHAWDVPRAEVARVWMAGCIIRSRVLRPIHDALERDPGISDLLLDPALARTMAGVQDGWRRAVAECARRGIPAPCWSAALAWYDGARSERLPQNLTQAQRDWFGAHRFRRLEGGSEPEHAEWATLVRQEVRR